MEKASEPTFRISPIAVTGVHIGATTLVPSTRAVGTLWLSHSSSIVTRRGLEKRTTAPGLTTTRST